MTTEEYLKQTDYFGYVYLIIDQKQNKLYIGHKTGLVENSEKYYGSGKIIRRIIKSRGTYLLKKIILGVCYSRKELLACETECKLFFDALNPKYGYNKKLEDEGAWGIDFTEEHRKNLSKGQKGRSVWNKGLTKEKDERVKKLSESRIGVPLSKEHKNNISKSNKGIPKNTKGKPGWRRGLTKETDERIRKYSEARKGHEVSEETKRKIGLKSAIHKHSIETKKKLGDQKRNKTYEEMYGKEKADQIKLKQSGRIPWNKDSKMSEEFRKKVSKGHKGQIPWCTGKKLTEEHKRNISEGHKQYYKKLKEER
jgi:hypothetical protein